MRAIHQLIGCALCIAGIGSAAAVNLDVPDMGSTPHATNTATPRDSSSVEAPEANRDAAPASSDSAGSSANRGNERSGDAAPAPTPAPRTHLGWQSLLPGSIQ